MKDALPVARFLLSFNKLIPCQHLRLVEKNISIATSILHPFGGVVTDDIKALQAVGNY
jgi:hypothetical protein